MELKPHLKAISDFFEKSDIKVTPLPKIILISKEPDEELFIPTGQYDADASEIKLFIAGRHPKDILRSFAHELFHHHQYIDDPIKYAKCALAGDLEDTPDLQELEAEAYKNGNILFRKWTEQARKSNATDDTTSSSSATTEDDDTNEEENND